MEVYTTGDVATICQVARRTVSKWFDSGRLKGYRVTGSKDRRILRKDLVAFMSDNEMSLARVDEFDPQHLMIVTADTALASQLKSQLSETIEITVAATSFEAGIHLAARRPLMLIVEFSNTIAGARHLCERVLSPVPFQGVPIIIAIAENQYAAQLREMGINDVFPRPFDPALLVLRMKTLVERRKLG